MWGVLVLWLWAALPGLLGASPLFLERNGNTSSICKPAPHWKVQGQSPMEGLLGDVVVVALLKAS